MNKRKDLELYFIGIVPPEPLFSELWILKELFAQNYDSTAALRSPPHITLHMPFKLEQPKLASLKLRLEDILKTYSSFEILLSDYGAFPPRVIYVEVVSSGELQNLHQNVRRIMRNEFNFLNQDYKDQSFHPHITMAFRDLRKHQFRLAWDKYKNEKFENRFICSSISILKHNGKIWQVNSEIPLA